MRLFARACRALAITAVLGAVACAGGDTSGDTEGGSGGAGAVAGVSADSSPGGGGAGEAMAGNAGGEAMAGNAGGEAMAGNSGGEAMAGNSGGEAMAGNSGGEAMAGNSGGETPEAGAKFILHQQLPPDLVYLANNVALYDALPFDGTTFVFSKSTQIQRTNPVDGAALKEELGILKGKPFLRAKHNMVIVYATPSGSFSDYAVQAANFGKLAAAIRESGNIEAIKFDVEEYFGDAWHSHCGGLSESACRAAAHAAGKMVMAEIIRQWPEARVMTTFGPWISSTQAYKYFGTLFPVNDVAFANTYQGNFFAGMVEATYGTQAKYIDGGEHYQIQGVTAYAAFKTYMRQSFPGDAPYIVPPSIRASWADHYHASFGTYDWPGETPSWFKRPAQTAAMVRKENADALQGTDEYVWFYSERFNFANNPRSGDKPNVPGDWMQALTDAWNSK